MNRFIVYISAIFLGCSCSSSNSSISDDGLNTLLEVDTVGVDEFKAFLIDNHSAFEAEKVLEKLNLSARFVPCQYSQLRELDTIDSQLSSEYCSNESYVFQIGLNKGKTDFLKSGLANLDHKELVDYLSFKIESDFTLQVNNKIYKCISCVFERSYGISPKVTLNLSFQKPVSAGSRTLVYNDKILEAGIVKIKVVDSEMIQSIPFVKEEE